MPDYTSPATDALISAEQTPLHLPSLFSTTQRAHDCPVPLVKAETKVRHSSMATSIEDLIRHLTTCTFLHRDRVKNVTGVHANTRARNVIACVSRRVDASAGAYRRHRVAYKILFGSAPAGWEIDFRPLTSADVRGLSEKAVSDEGIQAWYWATKLANVNQSQAAETRNPMPASQDVDQGTDNPGDGEAGLVPINTGAPGVLAEALAPGEGT
jgi:hypothetical protein